MKGNLWWFVSGGIFVISIFALGAIVAISFLDFSGNITTRSVFEPPIPQLTDAGIGSVYFIPLTGDKFMNWATEEKPAYEIMSMAPAKRGGHDGYFVIYRSTYLPTTRPISR